ncbi:Rv2175c family DNA-binding protein [Streptacidiphilus monticola]|uniref:Rv2175c family DNA-binding protein n=1 Tax=Streptacidiphilus monticola TaxID=2161674 RepID=A0ABW1FW49_9ACTN
MSEIDPKTDALIPEWMYLPDIAEKWGVEVTRVRNMVSDGTLIAVRRGENRALQVPAAFIGEDKPVRGVPGTLTVLRDAGFSDEEALEWLFTEDPTLPGTPAQALRDNRGTEVKRRAQAMAL